ncbi:helix-turn-helix domain-containing protein [Candidatus Woesearchaeota archaeon]|nr:helix-turn-helix domain-containing protein [Candidatus Woesearchaeota archaeon]
MAIEYALEKAGLRRQEAEAYLAALKLGVAKASEIAKKAGVAREAAYYILKSLQEKGFISEVIKSGVKHYSAVQPKRILQIIEEEKQRKAEAIHEALPELEALQKIAITRPTIEVYEGIQGFKTIASLLVEKPNIIISAYVPESILHFLPTFHAQFRRRRKEQKIVLKAITQRTPFMIETKKSDKEEARELRFNDQVTKNIDDALFILPNAIVIIKANAKEQLGIYIKERSAAKLQQQLFDAMWVASQ